ncbi:MAG: hypothetical protein PVJ09_05535 [Candidatus Woesebacteria bacterium]|jgi:cupin fold WbuC family metalloprotein
MKKKIQTKKIIKHLGETIALIIKANHQVDNLEFFTKDNDPLQVGIHQKEKGIKLTPHIHLSNTKVVSEVHEVLYIIEGKIRVTYYTIDGDIITKFILNKGDILIHQKMGHGFEILEDAKIFEVKQGPFPGTKHAKIFLKNKNK